MSTDRAVPIRSASRRTLFLALPLIAFLGLVVLPSFRSVVYDWNDLPSGSMRPSLVEGDRILTHKAAYELPLPFTRRHLVRRAEPQRGDVVLTVPAGKYFVMGDNRINSRDSRFFGFVDREQILGKAIRVVFSLDRKSVGFRGERQFLPIR